MSTGTSGSTGGRPVGGAAPPTIAGPSVGATSSTGGATTGAAGAAGVAGVSTSALGASTSASTSAAVAAAAAALSGTLSATSTPLKRRPSDAAARRLLSPAYSGARRHSLYGIEDRVVIDPGSRIWKVGFSGEPDPRGVFWAVDDATLEARRTGAQEMWDLDLGNVTGCMGNRVEARRIVAKRVDRRLREVFYRSLLTDGKARKVVIVENTFLPTYVKAEIARSLFDCLKVPSISFTPASLLSLAACGRITGLVVDLGWLETTISPVYCSRPLNNFARSTSLGGRALHQRLRALLRHYGQYQPAATESRSPRSPRSGEHRGSTTLVTPVPLSILTDKTIERVLTEACLVDPTGPLNPPAAMDLEPSESLPEIDDPALMSILGERYSAKPLRSADWTLSIPAPRGFGPCSYLIVPGWVRERAAELLFGDGPDEAESLTELLLETLLKLPVDLRPELSSSILVAGGLSSLPGLISRFRSDVLRRLMAEPEPVAGPGQDTRSANLAWRRRSQDRYACLSGISAKLAILNDPAPLDGQAGRETVGRGGNAPRWSPELLPWIGGSLAGVLKTSAPDLVREDYDQLVADSFERGNQYKAALDEERGDVSAPADGLELELMRPGTAINGLAAERKRGWTVNVVPDWTTAGVRAGV